MVALALAVLLVTLLAGQTGLAQYDEPERPSAGNETETILDDGSTPEVGIEWITDWPGTAYDRANWYHSANGLYKEMGGVGWIRRFFWGNTNSWERDFKRAALGGIEQSMYDAVDLGFLVPTAPAPMITSGAAI